jgi:hypothetical protein
VYVCLLYQENYLVYVCLLYQENYLGYVHPSFLKYATKVKLSTGAGLLVRDGTRYPLKMIIGTS